MQEEIINDKRGLSIPRIEDTEMVCLITLKTIGALLWFVNNRKLHERIAAYFARYVEMFEVIPFAIIIMGNHLHLLVRFPQGNRAAFMNAFGSMVARLTKWYVPNFFGGKLWARRYTVQFLPLASDVEHYFFYTALNPVSTGLCRDPREYMTYNSFASAALGRTEEYEVVDMAAYNSRKRYKKNVDIKEYTKVHSLTYQRLPGHEDKTAEEYERYLQDQWEKRRKGYIEEKGPRHKFLNRGALARTVPGTAPKNPKTTQRNSKMPVVLTSCPKTKAACLETIFTIAVRYRDTSLRYRRGDRTATFPAGTYRPRTKVRCHRCDS